MSFTYVQVITVSSELSFFSRWIGIVSRIMVITLAEHRTPTICYSNLVSEASIRRYLA